MNEAVPKNPESQNPEAHTPARDLFEIERPEQLKALGHPLRLKVLQVLGESEQALTNRELAARLSVDPGHLHFHVRMLHRAGLFASAGEFRSAQLHAKLDVETVREVFNELMDKLTELEDESKPPLSITVAFHPLITQGETD